MKAANDMLAESRLKGGDVRITSVRQVPEGFHARFSAKGKRYVYRIFCGDQMPVFLRNYRYHVRRPLNTEAMAHALKAFEGTKDFRGFMAAGSTLKGPTVRTIYETSLKANPVAGISGADEGACPSEIEISVKGSGFLYNMVRIIVGTLSTWEREKYLRKVCLRSSHRETGAGPGTRRRHRDFIWRKYFFRNIRMRRMICRTESKKDPDGMNISWKWLKWRGSALPAFAERWEPLL